MSCVEWYISLQEVVEATARVKEFIFLFLSTSNSSKKILQQVVLYKS